MDVTYRYRTPPSERVLRAIRRISEVYGIRRIKFDETQQTILLEYDATRLSKLEVASLLRNAGLELGEELKPAV